MRLIQVTHLHQFSYFLTHNTVCSLYKDLEVNLVYQNKEVLFLKSSEAQWMHCSSNCRSP